MEDIEISISFTNKLKEILKELAKPKKFEVGFVDARRIVSDGLAIIGMDAVDILGFAKEETETRTRRTKGAHAWYKRMYEDGWRFAGAFEYEGLLYNGFVIMEREIPNKKLIELIESLTGEEKNELPINLEIDRGPELPKIVEQKFKDEAIGSVYKGKKEEIEKATEKVEGFSVDIQDFIKEAQGGLKSLEELFFDETGKHAVWKGKETKAFKDWKQNRD